jgi:hypothetical protein
MSDGRIISNYGQTGTLPHVYIQGRKVLRSDLPRDHPAYSAPIRKLPALNRRDEEGLATARQMTASQTPSEIHNLRSLRNICRQYGNDPRAHQLVRANIWRHSTMVTTADLRDDRRYPNGEARIGGAIFRDALTALKTRRVRLTIWVEIPGNYQRAVWILKEILDLCPLLERLDVDFTAERDLGLSRAVMGKVRKHMAPQIKKRGIIGDIEATVVDRE